LASPKGLLVLSTQQQLINQLTVGFIYDPTAYELIMATSFNLIATTLKLGKRGMVSAEIFATSLVADLHLLPALYLFFVLQSVTSAQGLALGGCCCQCHFHYFCHDRYY